MVKQKRITQTHTAGRPITLIRFKTSRLTPSELSEKNYRRIALLNWSLVLPLLLIFAWPYHLICELAGIDKAYRYAGSVLFALPFAITILHGHVTMALGSLHRHHFYNWLEKYPTSYGLFFHRVFISTRFRLAVFLTSLALTPVGLFLSSG